MPEPNEGRNKKQQTAQLFTREPVMLTLPFAYGLALIVWKFPGGAWSTNRWSALLTAFVVFLLDRYSTEQAWTPNETKIRLVYIALNTIILTGLLTGLTTIDKLSTIVSGG